MNPGHKARKNPSDNADLGFQAVGPALRIMQLNVEGLSAAKRHIIDPLLNIQNNLTLEINFSPTYNTTNTILKLLFK